LQTPDEYVNRVKALCSANAIGPFRGQCVTGERQNYLAMAMYFDYQVGRVIQALKDSGQYDNTLILFTGDNGGPIGKKTVKHEIVCLFVVSKCVCVCEGPGTGGNMYPFKGGKSCDWEGGFIAPAALSGGWLPKKLRGT
jgi:arylsulfatase A-like enzyme